MINRTSERSRGTNVLIREATPEEIQAWGELVTRFDSYRIFHKQSWIRSIEAFSGAKPLYLVFEKGGEMVACLPGFLVEIAFLRLFASPREGWQTESMGPVFDPAKISTREMFATLIPFLEQRYGVQHIELACAHLHHKTMKDLGFQGEMLFTYRVALFPDDEDRVIGNMHRRTRTYVRTTQKSGLIAQLETEESFVDEIYDQSKEAFARHGKAVSFSKNRVLHLFRNMKESGNLLAISIREPDDGTCIATGTFLIEGQELCLWSWTHRAQYGRYHPIELLTWTAMQRGMQAGCTTFDMGGGGKAKRKFGAVPDETVYRWIRSRYRWLAWLRELARKALRWQQSLRGRMVQKMTSGNEG
jgi:hypothetical protein